MQKFKKIVLIIAALIVVCAASVIAFYMFANYSDGYRVGQVQKMARKGFLFKTWEGELVQGFLENSPSSDGATDTGGVATRLWYFTVDNDEKVLADIEQAITQNHRVKLFYNEKYVALPWIGDTRHIVYKVEHVQ